MPMRHRGSPAKNGNSFARLSRLRINPVNLKHRLRQVDANHYNRFHPLHTDSKMPVELSAVHAISCGHWVPCR